MLMINKGLKVAEFLRLNLTDRKITRAYSTSTETISTVSTGVKYELTQINVRAIVSVVLDGVTLRRFIDYTYDLGMGRTDRKCTILFNSPTGAGTDNLVITFKHSGTEWIYDDWPSFQQLGVSSYPRISVSYINSFSVLQGQSSTNTISTDTYQIDVWTHIEALVGLSDLRPGVPQATSYSLSDYNLTQYYIEVIKKEFKENFRSHFNGNFTNYKITSSRPILPTEDNNILRGQITVEFTEVDGY